MVSQGVIEKVETPTDWVNSMVIVERPDKTLRICLDPRNFNDAVRRVHFQLPTVEEIGSRLTGAQYFTNLDASQGFWQIQLDDRRVQNTPHFKHLMHWRRKRGGGASAPPLFRVGGKDMFVPPPHTFRPRI